MACGVTAFGQFIPQPMGYNPDVNGDEFIGVDDVMGTLALYDNAFDNGDSLVITSWTFPEDYQEPYASNPENYSYAHTYIDEATDVVYIHQTEDQSAYFYLPQGVGYKVVQIFLSCDGFAQWDCRIMGTSDLSSYMYGGTFLVYDHAPVVLTMIRGHNGKWYQGGPTQ